MKTFEQRTGYKAPVVISVNKSVIVGIHYPLKKKDDAIIDIYNSKSKESISLFSKTLIQVSNNFIQSILQSSTFFFNKEKERKLNKRKTKK